MKTIRLSILLAAILLCCQISARATITDTLRINPPSECRKDTPTTLPPFARKSSVKRPLLAFRSNLLVPVMNVGVEVPLSNRFSIAADYYYPWAPKELVDKVALPRQMCFQGLGGYLETRWWLGPLHDRRVPEYARYRLLGHSLAFIAAAGYYDYEANGPEPDHIIKDWTGTQGELFAAGVDYLYAAPLGRKGRAHIEFEFALGAIYHIWHPYNVYEENGYLIRAKDANNQSIYNRTKILAPFPMKACVSIVVPIYTDKPVQPGKNRPARQEEESL